MRIDSAGNVGIGTTDPVSQLTVSDGGNTGIEIFSANSIGNMQCYDRVGLAYEPLQLSAEEIVLRTGTATVTDKMVIDSTGNVGIGDLAPAEVLSIEALTNPRIKFTDTGNWTSSIGVEGSSGAFTFENVDGTERMRIDANGFVGINTTTPGVKLQVKTDTATSDTAIRLSDDVTQTLNVIVDGTATTGGILYENPNTGYQAWSTSGVERMRILSTGRVQLTPNNEKFALQLNNGAANNGPFLGSDGADIFTVSNSGGTERMRIDASGNVGIGDTNPPEKLTVASGVIRVNNTSAPVSETDGGAYFYKTSAGATMAAQVGVSFRAGGQERMRIDSSGRLLIGQTSTIGGALVQTLFTGAAPINVGRTENDTTAPLIEFRINTSTGSGLIKGNGASQAAFGTFSDARLKENIITLDSQLDNIMALRPVSFDYIESEGGGSQIGFIAQEVEEVYPDLVSEREDGMKIITGLGKQDSRLIKAIQEQQELINTLTARLDALEA